MASELSRTPPAPSAPSVPSPHPGPAPARPRTPPPDDAGRPAGTGPGCGIRAGPRGAPTTPPGRTRARGRTAPPPPRQDRGGPLRRPGRTPRGVPERDRASARDHGVPAPPGLRSAAVRSPGHRSRGPGSSSAPRDLRGGAGRTASPAMRRRPLRPMQGPAGAPSPPSRPEAAGGAGAPPAARTCFHSPRAFDRDTEATARRTVRREPVGNGSRGRRHTAARPGAAPPRSRHRGEEPPPGACAPRPGFRW